MPDPLANARAGMPINHDFAIIDTPDGPMTMFCAYPDGEGPFPAAIVISGQPGPSSPEILGAEVLANQGYVGCAIDLMHRGPAIHANADQVARRQGLTDAQTIMDMNAGIDYLKSQRGKHFDPTCIDAFLSDRGAIETVLREFAD